MYPELPSSSVHSFSEEITQKYPEILQEVIITMTSPSNAAIPFTVLVEGNIGAGKTTFLKHFEKFDDVCLVAEPVEKWRNLNGVNMYDMLYKNPEEFAMPFQSYVAKTMLQNHIQRTDKPIKIMERSLFSARYCFVERMMSKGMLHQGMYNVLQEWYEFIDEQFQVQCDLIVYLRTTPEVALERVKQRARDEESCLTIEYTRDIHQLHDDWLIHGKFSKPAQVLVLNADLDFENIVDEYRRFEHKYLEPIMTKNMNRVILASKY